VAYVLPRSVVSNRLFSRLCNKTVGNVTLHGFGRGQTVQAPLAKVTVCLSDVDCKNVCELPIMCAVTDFSLHDCDVILPAAVVRNLQAKAVVSRGLCNGPTMRTCCKEQPGVNVTTADRLSSETKRGAAVGSKPRLSRTDRQPKHNLRCGVFHLAYAVAMFCIFCVALIICIALCSVIDDRNSMFGNVLTPIPVVSSCLLPSQRFEDDKVAHLQPGPRQERRQLLVMFAADQFNDRPGRCDAGIHRIQATDGLV